MSRGEKMKRKLLYLFLAFIIFVPVCVMAQTRCEFTGTLSSGQDYPAGSVVFNDNDIVVYLKEGTGELSYSNSGPVKYFPNMADELSKFNERGKKCPKWIVRYGNVIKFNIFWDDEESAKDSLVTANTGFFKQVKVFKVSSNAFEPSHVREDETHKKYTKEFQSRLHGDEYGNLMFEVSYSRENDDFAGFRLYFTKKENINIKVIDDSIDSFRQKMLAVVKGGYNIANIYCAKRDASNNPDSRAVMIGGESVNNGDIFCSFEQGQVLGNRVMIFSTDVVPPEKEEDDEDDEKEYSESDPVDSGDNYDVTPQSVCVSPSYRKPMRFIGWILGVIRYLVPLVIIVLGAFDFYKSMASSDAEKGSKASIKSLIVRVGAGVFIFLLPGIIEFILGFVSTWNSGNPEYDYSRSWACCGECILNSNCDVSGDTSSYCK